VGILALAPASFENVITGQNGFLTAACLIGGLRCMKKRPVLSGILFGFLAIKPQLGILVPVALCAERQWKTLFTAAVTVVLLVLLSVLLFGAEPWQAYFHTTLAYQNAILRMNVVPLQPFQALSPTPFMALRILGVSLPVAYSVAAIFALGGIYAVWWAFSKPATSTSRQQAVLLTAMFLVTPYALSYDLTTLSVAVLLMLDDAPGYSLTEKDGSLLLFIWLLPLTLYLFNCAGLPLAPVAIAALLGLQLQKLYRLKPAEACIAPQPCL
jgi:hypothetical protein